MFHTQYTARERGRFYQPVGSPEKITYSPVFDEKGHLSLIESGKENLYAYIQSHKDSVDIHVLLKRYANGEVDVLSKVQGAYGDFTAMPKTYAEMLNIINRGEVFFNELPVETRASFGHSFSQFLAAMDQPGFLEKIGLSAKQAEKVVEQVSQEVKEVTAE